MKLQNDLLYLQIYVLQLRFFLIMYYVLQQENVLAVSTVAFVCLDRRNVILHEHRHD